MFCMFERCTSFNQPLRFDTSKVTNMVGMFRRCSSFNQPLHFDTSNVINMKWMFFICSSFNQPIHFDTSNANVKKIFKQTPIQKLLNKYKYMCIKNLPKNISIQSIDTRHRFLQSLNDHIKNNHKIHDCLTIKEMIHIIISFI